MNNTILVIEDSKSIIHFLNTTLTENGYNVSIATNGVQGLTIAQKLIPEIILLDILMPEMDGYETCKHLKENEATKNIPVIFLSALSQTFDKVKAFQLGAVDYLSKPIEIDELLARVRTHLTLSRLQKEILEANELLEEKVNLRTSEFLETNKQLERKNLEYAALNENYKIQNTELKIAKEKAEESDCLKTAFLNNMSHEIRTPMNAINGFSELLSKPSLTEEKRQSYISIINNSSLQLQLIVEDLLTISSLETKQEKVYSGSFSMNDVFMELERKFKPLAQNKNLELISVYPSDIPLNAVGDKSKISKIFSYLIGNALKFTNHGKVEFGFYKNKKTLECFVKDTGIGISPEKHCAIFNRFVQVETNLNRQYEGNGLGLSIAKGYVELLGGKIWLESEIEKGSVFYFTIPEMFAKNL